MSNNAKVSIVIAGHTNTGKTTLIRTLMKTSIGEVDDRANVTKIGQSYYYDSLQADFIDTPGFRDASVYSMYLDMLEENPDSKIPTKWEEKIRLDSDAIEAIKKSTAAIYVGSLSVVPDDSHIEEMDVVRRLQPKVIGVLNQYQSQLKASSKSIVDGRIDSWKDKLTKKNISHIIVFDAHWDKYSKVHQIYDSICKILNEKEKIIFSEGLEFFKKRQKEIQKEACNMLSECVQKLQKIEITMARGNYSEEEISNKISQMVLKSIVDFIKNVIELYKVAAEYPTETKQALQMRLKANPNISSRFSSALETIAVCGGGGATIGSVIGGVITGVLSGGLGAKAGSELGRQIGTVIGGGIGSLAGIAILFDNDNDTVTIRMTSEEIKNVVIECLTTIWGLSINGYGRDRELTEDETKKIEQQIRDITESFCSLNWTDLEKHTIANYCESVLEELENSW